MHSGMSARKSLKNIYKINIYLCSKKTAILLKLSLETKISLATQFAWHLFAPNSITTL